MGIAVKNKKPRVLVAMSGGVDSSVAAQVLVEQGFDVVGVTMQVWDYSQSECSIEEGNGTCCSSLDVDDARAVADKIGIPFYVVNCEAKFKAYVIDDFIESYMAGRTPIPCVNCNTYLKFDHLYQKMQELDCQYLATGHYARVEKSEDGRPRIITSEDSHKDQTYFLFTLNPQIVEKLMFPIGEWTKDRVRAYALEHGLSVAKKRDSTGICFIGKNDYVQFLDQHVPRDLCRPGMLKKYPSGEVLGEHQGIHRFTYGQRKGLGVTGSEPLYVIKIDADSNTVWLGSQEHLLSKKVSIEKTNWLGPVNEGEVFRVKIRYAHAGASAKITKQSAELVEIEFEEPQRAITPGQAAVFYRGPELVGGGWIQ